MTDHGLDLAVIGNGRTAALVDPCARVVWWCYPRFDSDPIFCRLLSGDDEKGFSDVVLDDLADFNPNIFVIPQWYRRFSPTGAAAPSASPTLRLVIGNSAAFSDRRNSSG